MRRFFIFLLACSVFYSCKDDQKRQAEINRDLKKKQTVFAAIDKAWLFDTHPQNPTAASLVSTWAEWRILMDEFSQKPKSTMDAFRRKAKALSLKAKELGNKIPVQYDRPEVKSRIAVLQTKINSLDLYINLSDIPQQNVIAVIGDINTELTSMQLQVDEISRRSQIPKEAGEADMIRMLDTARAIPDKPSVITAPNTRDPRPTPIRQVK